MVAWQAGVLDAWAYDEHGRRTAEAELRLRDDEGRLLIRRLLVRRYPDGGTGEFDAHCPRTAVDLSAGGTARISHQPEGMRGASLEAEVAVAEEHLWTARPGFDDWPAHPVADTLRDWVAARLDSAASGWRREPSRLRGSTDFDRLFRPGTRLPGLTVLDPVPCGSLRVPSGVLAVACPQSWDETPRITVAVPPGTYLVKAAPVEVEDRGYGSREEAVAVRLQLCDAPVAAREMALGPGDDTLGLRAGEAFGFGTDAAAGAFGDAGVWQDLRDQLERANRPGSPEADKLTGSVVGVRLDGGSLGADLVGFYTGGDGVYPVWVGRSASGEVVCVDVQTAFDLASTPEPRCRSRFSRPLRCPHHQPGPRTLPGSGSRRSARVAAVRSPRSSTTRGPSGGPATPAYPLTSRNRVDSGRGPAYLHRGPRPPGGGRPYVVRSRGGSTAMSFSAPGSPPPPPQPSQPNPAPYQVPYPVHQQGHPYPGGPVHMAPPGPQSTLRSPKGLATALAWLLGAGAAVRLFSAGVGAYEQSWLQGFSADTHFDDLELGLAPGLTVLAGLLQVLTVLPTVVVFIVWFHRVRSNGGIFRPDAFTLGRGWAIGAWFVPVANLFLPCRIALQTWRASVQRGPDGSDRTASAALLTSWWVVWVLAATGDRVFSRIYMAAETVDELLMAGKLGIAADLVTTVAGVLALLFVRRLTAMQNTMATEGPYARA